MLNEALRIGQRVQHASRRWSGVVVDRAATARGRQLAVVLVDGETEPRMMLAEFLIAA